MKRRGFFGLLLAPLVALFASRVAPKAPWWPLRVRENMRIDIYEEPEVFYGSTSLYEALDPEAGSALDRHMRHLEEQLRRQAQREALAENQRMLRGLLR